tara:strand:- start:1581 stop:1937 length:357 start_codon:yes stop_codon:yes gene_type:complete
MPYNYNCKVRKIVDGDTIDVDIDLGFNTWLYNQRIRLSGIDTPESRTRNIDEKALGLAAKRRLKEVCKGTIQLESHGRDKYGRILGIPYSEDGTDICFLMIEEGHAVVYDGGAKKVWV